MKTEKLHIEKLLSLSESELKQGLIIVAAEEEVRTKILLLSKIYQELAKKYSLVVRNDSDDLSGRSDLSPDWAGISQ